MITHNTALLTPLAMTRSASAWSMGVWSEERGTAVTRPRASTRPAVNNVRKRVNPGVHAASNSSLRPTDSSSNPGQTPVIRAPATQRESPRFATTSLPPAVTTDTMPVLPLRSQSIAELRRSARLASPKQEDRQDSIVSGCVVVWLCVCCVCCVCLHGVCSARFASPKQEERHESILSGRV